MSFVNRNEIGREKLFRSFNHRNQWCDSNKCEKRLERKCLLLVLSTCENFGENVILLFYFRHKEALSMFKRYRKVATYVKEFKRRIVETRVIKSFRECKQRLRGFVLSVSIRLAFDNENWCFKNRIQLKSIKRDIWLRLNHKKWSWKKHSTEKALNFFEFFFR